MTPKLVIFDCDGVLVETESITDQVLSAYFTQRGAPIPPEEVHNLFAGGTMMGAGQDAIARGAVLPDDWLEDISNCVNAALTTGVTVFDGLFDLLDALDTRGVQTAIASNGPMSKMQTSLGPSGLWNRFAGRIYSGRITAPKPAPDMLLAACAQAGVTVGEAVMIDDTPTGIGAADAAGMRAIGFAASSSAAKLAATGHPVTLTMAEIRVLLAV